MHNEELLGEWMGAQIWGLIFRPLKRVEIIGSNWAANLELSDCGKVKLSSLKDTAKNI
jgi:hypothetical protein